MLRHRLFVLFFGLTLALTGCDDGDGDTDAGTGDAGEPVEPGELFDPCTSDAECGGDSVCRTSAEGFPGGYCTYECTDRTPCDDGFVYNHCFPRGDDPDGQAYCELRCLNGIDCGREGWTCQAGIFPDESGACIPVCSSDEQCGNGASCNRYTGECTMESISPSGAIAGEACTEDTDCRSGLCQADVNTQAQPTGWVNGYCLGYCILPPGYNTNTFYEGDALPTGSCPDESVCFPASFGAASQRDLGFCLDQCASDGECREGYFCRQDFAIGMSVASFTNGVCWPADCTTNGCPAGYECTMTGDSAVCAPVSVP